MADGNKKESEASTCTGQRAAGKGADAPSALPLGPFSAVEDLLACAVRGDGLPGSTGVLAPFAGVSRLPEPCPEEDVFVQS